MSATRALPRHGYQNVTSLETRKQKWKRKSRIASESIRGFAKVAVYPRLRHAAEHTYTIAAIVCADWAAWLWNDKAGLITAAILLILFELKVGS
jgi:hypothetical protein